MLCHESYAFKASLSLKTTRGPPPPIPLHTKPRTTFAFTRPRLPDGEQVESTSVKVKDSGSLSNDESEYCSAHENSTDDEVIRSTLFPREVFTHIGV
jgi:hypothetical protein